MVRASNIRLGFKNPSSHPSLESPAGGGAFFFRALRPADTQDAYIAMAPATTRRHVGDSMGGMENADGEQDGTQ